MSFLSASHLHWSAGGRQIVKDVSVDVAERECVGVIGPNGCGKSSLLRMLYRAVKPQSGKVTWLGRDLRDIPQRAFSRDVAVLTQEFSQVFDFSVHELVMMGRIPHQSAWQKVSAQDQQIVAASLEMVGCLHLIDSDFSLLSGGEKQRVLLARALVQQPRVLVLDEPTNHLDVRYQHELMALIKKTGRAAIVAIHDLNIAAQYCDRIYLMQDGQLLAQGSPQDVLTAENISSVYGVQALVDTHPITGKPRVSFWTEAYD